MNAYELADYLEADFQIQEGVIDMLRYQADYIAQIEKGLESSLGLNKAQAERIAMLEAQVYGGTTK